VPVEIIAAVHYIIIIIIIIIINITTQPSSSVGRMSFTPKESSGLNDEQYFYK